MSGPQTPAPVEAPHQVFVSGSLHCSFGAVVDLPAGAAWSDIEAWYIKWDNLHFQIDGEWHEAPLHSDPSETTDWKRPIEGSVEIYAAFEDETDYERLLGEA